MPALLPHKQSLFADHLILRSGIFLLFLLFLLSLPFLFLFFPSESQFPAVFLFVPVFRSLLCHPVQTGIQPPPIPAFYLLLFLLSVHQESLFLRLSFLLHPLPYFLFLLHTKTYLSHFLLFSVLFHFPGCLSLSETPASPSAHPTLLPPEILPLCHHFPHML